MEKHVRSSYKYTAVQTSQQQFATKFREIGSHNQLLIATSHFVQSCSEKKDQQNQQTKTFWASWDDYEMRSEFELSWSGTTESQHKLNMVQMREEASYQPTLADHLSKI